jgi:hypothetical protein
LNVRHNVAEPVSNASPDELYEEAAAIFERKLEFCQPAWRTFLLPFVPGPAIFIMGFLIPEQGFAKAIGLTTALMVSPFLVWIPLNRREVRKLRREIDSLDALMKQP